MSDQQYNLEPDPNDPNICICPQYPPEEEGGDPNDPNIVI